MSDDELEKFIPREMPPILPMGFRFGIASDICIIDFIDTPDENVRKVSYSIAITKTHAKDLVANLEKFINEEWDG